MTRGRWQGNKNPRDPRYRTDQPWPVGTRVLLYSGGPEDNIEWLIQRYGTRELIAIVLDVLEQTFMGYCPVEMVQRADGKQIREQLQWPIDGLIPEDEWPQGDLETWLDS